MERKERDRLYYQNNKERVIARQLEYTKRNESAVKEYQAKYRKENKKSLLDYFKIDHIKNRDKKLARKKEIWLDKKHKFFEMYGTSCECCGETTYEFLTLDHKLGQRKGTGGREGTYNAYVRAIKEYKPDEFRTLCMNCNHSYGIRGYCPHNK
jgi:hypothetical protein